MTICVVVAMLAVLMGANQYESSKPGYGELVENELLHYASCWGGDNVSCQPVKKYSGRIWTGSGQIESVGKATVTVAACWDWGRSTPSGEINEIYTADHKGALMVVTPQNFKDKEDVWFEADATVTIEDKAGDTIVGAITGGSCYELIIHDPGPGSINEWVICFEIVGGTNEFDGATGTGMVRMVWDSDREDGAYNDVGYVDDPARFLEHEIFLSMVRAEAQ